MPANDHAHDLVGALEDRVDPEISEVLLDLVVLEIAIAAMQLETE